MKIKAFALFVSIPKYVPLDVFGYAGLSLQKIFVLRPLNPFEPSLYIPRLAPGPEDVTFTVERSISSDETGIIEEFPVVYIPYTVVGTLQVIAELSTFTTIPRIFVAVIGSDMFDIYIPIRGVALEFEDVRSSVTSSSRLFCANVTSVVGTVQPSC